MPVTFNIANHPANPVSWAPGKDSKRVVPPLNQFLISCSPMEAKDCKEVLQTSFQDKDLPFLKAQSNGFVHTVTSAYNQHHHLQLRPDDLWMAIVSQFSFYVNAHAEDLRSQFVAHEGKKRLVVRRSGSRYSVDFGDVATEMTTLMDKFIVDPELKDWILPEFSTTTPTDTIIYAIQMMSTLKAYFEYICCIDCGLPSITLLGEKADWEALLSRIEKFHSFGEETQKWANLLTPIITRFVEAFDGNTDIEFWGRMVDVHIGGSGPSYLSGWITAFCFWATDGTLLWKAYGRDKKKHLVENPTRGIKVVDGYLTIDGQFYEPVDLDNVPQAYCDVPMIVLDNGEVFNTTMIAGHMATAVLESPTTKEWDTMRPAPGWFMFINSGGSTKAGADEVKSLDAELKAVDAALKARSKKKGKKGHGLGGTLKQIQRVASTMHRVEELKHTDQPESSTAKKNDGKCNIM